MAFIAKLFLALSENTWEKERQINVNAYTGLSPQQFLTAFIAGYFMCREIGLHDCVLAGGAFLWERIELDDLAVLRRNVLFFC